MGTWLRVKGASVLDLSEAVTGAYATRLLASMGADVIVGERPEGSPLRRAPPLISTPAGPRSTPWEYLAAFKTSVVVEPNEVDEVASRFDAVVLATDGPAAPTGELATRLRIANPRLVVAAITPFGLTGPYSEWRAGPLEQWATGGHLILNGEPDREPIPGGGPWQSHLVGATAAVAIQGALMQARDEARGSLIDVGAMAALAAAHQWSITMYTHTGAIKKRAGNRMGEMHHPIALYPCHDGWVCIAAASLHQWEGLCIAMDRVELLADDDLANAAVRFDRADEIDQAIKAWTANLTMAEVVAACQEHFCPAGPVAELTDVIADDQLAHRNYWCPIPALGPKVVMPSAPFQLPSTPPTTPAPNLGSGAIPSAEPTPRPSGRRGRGRGRGSHAHPERSAPDRAEAPVRFAPLAGVRVLELTVSWAGPLAGRFLADLGADVVKIEHPTSRGVAVSPPDPDAAPLAWAWGQLAPALVRNGTYPDTEPGDEWWNRMSMWNKMNRSKRSLCLDIKGPGGRAVFDQLVASADIVLSNYSPRGVRSLSIGHETLRTINPKLVTVAMSGFGETGPGAEAVSWGPILDAGSGLAATTGYPDSGPYKQGVAYPDPVGGTHGATAVLAAWWEGQRTGDAVHVDLSQFETLLAIAGDQVIETSACGHPPLRRGARSAHYAPAGVYECAGHDRWLALTVYDEADWTLLVTVIPALDRAQWAGVEARRVHHDEIDRLITAWTSARSPNEAMAGLQRAGLAAVAAVTNQDLVEDPQLAARGF
ncbi:MAG: CoA transferase, partial [Actinomycetia bacterium]|nr:CoA transferase [Actinomycetes bacterium]